MMKTWGWKNEKNICIISVYIIQSYVDRYVNHISMFAVPDRWMDGWMDRQINTIRWFID